MGCIISIVAGHKPSFISPGHSQIMCPNPVLFCQRMVNYQQLLYKHLVQQPLPSKAAFSYWYSVLDKEVSLMSGSLSILCLNNAGGPVKIEHVDQLLFLLLQLLNLFLQIRINSLQFLGLLSKTCVSSHLNHFSQNVLYNTSRDLSK